MQFNPERLISARDARGITQKALSTIIDYTPTTISKWENGKTKPDADAIIKLSKALGVNELWFSLRVPSTDAVYQFRSQSKATLGARSIAKRRLEWLRELTNSLEEWVEFPDVNLIESPSRDKALRLSDCDIEDYAIQLRRLWNLSNSPVNDLISIIESNGIIVSREEFGFDSMDGVSAWYERPYIWVSSDKNNFFRSRFDIAHELGHIVLHRNLLEEDCLKSRYNEVERQAHLFASHFLLPREAIAHSYKSVTLDSLLFEKKQWGLSVAALIMQYNNLDLISDEHKTRLFRNYSYRKWKKNEPFDAEVEAENPSVLRTAIDLLISDGGFSKQDICRKTLYEKSDIKSLCCLPDDFFETKVYRPKLKLL